MKSVILFINIREVKLDRSYTVFKTMLPETSIKKGPIHGIRTNPKPTVF
jgi:hypothetical protein